jgi:hypothetical protein
VQRLADIDLERAKGFEEIGWNFYQRSRLKTRKSKKAREPKRRVDRLNLHQYI